MRWRILPEIKFYYSHARLRFMDAKRLQSSQNFVRQFTAVHNILDIHVRVIFLLTTTDRTHLPAFSSVRYTTAPNSNLKAPVFVHV